MKSTFDEFVKSIETICEVWTIVYKKFRKMGFSRKEARAHTRDFMSSTMLESFKHGGTK